MHQQNVFSGMFVGTPITLALWYCIIWSAQHLLMG